MTPTRTTRCQECDMKTTAPGSYICRLHAGAQALLDAAKLALEELVYDGIPHGKAGLALKAAIANVEVRS